MSIVSSNLPKSAKVVQTPPAEHHDHNDQIVKNEAPAQTRFSQKPEGSEGLPKKRFSRLKDWFGRIKARRSEQKGIKKTRQEVQRKEKIKGKYQKAEQLRTQGKVAKKDFKKAFKLYKESADQGYVPSQKRLAEMYFSGEKNIKKNIKLSAFWYAKVANEGDISAFYVLGHIYSHEKGMKDYARAENYLTEASYKGHAGAQYALGHLHSKAGLHEPSYVKVKEWWEKAANQGHVEAQYDLGTMYRKGQGVRQDDKQAIAWFEQAANQGHVVAQYDLGGMYYQGRGVRQDDKQAIAWFEQAAAQGYALAQCYLGGMYSRGEGVERNVNEAIAWFEKSAAQGNKLAKKNLSILKGEHPELF